MKMYYNKILKIVVVGPPNVGKTSLLNRITQDQFYPQYLQVATMCADQKQKNIEIDGMNIQFLISDTAGQERFLHSLPPVYYRQASGIFITFDLSDEKSFHQLQQILESIQELLSNDIPKILVGCKYDLQNREVSEDIAKAFAKDLGIIYIETSSKTGHNCQDAFNILAKLSYSYSLSQDANNQAKQEQIQQHQQHNLKGQKTKQIQCC